MRSVPAFLLSMTLGYVLPWQEAAKRSKRALQNWGQRRRAGIAKWDVPNDWPELLGQLVSVINERKHTPAVDGAVRCLATFVEDLDDVQLVQVSPRLRNGKPFVYTSVALHLEIVRAPPLHGYYKRISICLMQLPGLA